MQKTKDPFPAVPKSFLAGFVLRISTLIIAIGASLTAIGFYLAPRDHVASYAGYYKLLAEVNQALVTKSLILFSFTLLLMFAGVAVISIIYSHRVAGPLFRLGMHSLKIASGDLSKPVHLRNTDVLHEMADDLNTVSARYRDTLVQLQIKTRELSDIMESEKNTPPDGQADSTDEISERIDEIRELLNQIKL